MRTRRGRTKTEKMDKLRLRVYKKVLKDVSAHFEEAENNIAENRRDIQQRMYIYTLSVLFA